MDPDKKYLDAQFMALGCGGLPETVMVDGRAFRFECVFKHSFAIAVALYETDGEKVVIKIHRQKRFFGLPLRWLGGLMAGYEDAVLLRCCGVDGVPRRRRIDLKTAVAHDYIPGRSLRPSEPVDDVFFVRLFNTLDQIHERGVAYVDLEKPANILKGEDGYPYLIDFQVAFYWPDNLPPGNCELTKLIREWFQRCDRYHACKHKHLRRMCQGAPAGRGNNAPLRKPWQVRAANALLAPWRMMRKLTVAGRKKH